MEWIMPELPEVEIVACELREKIQGKTVESIVAHWSKTFQNLTDVSLSGQIIHQIGRKGKYLMLELDYSFLIIHLRMTGQLILQTGGAIKEQHLRATIHFSDGNCLLFRDQRKFGRIYHVYDVQKFLSNIGIDALNPDFTTEVFLRLLKKSTMTIKALLLSQKYVSGLGNIYIDESLFRTKLHPLTQANSLTKVKTGELFTNIKNVLHQAISNMGSTISDYRDVNGNMGNNQHFFKVYQREGKPCPHCGTEIEKIHVGGRGTRICPSCQQR
ncbi:MAG: bifunctional DNA-formamidopyrimidine glycosylase/DNA-(apurinic or apyrimidinic site) lyase [Caldithrix sp.]|nr:bifunctional DNA-formamidopyrimidine glycosylase/DNA-(apurinic or apyrimidinic site) lyase [Caldithrix sp.]